jgi:NitT/TauT family transport system substrate-binding protein
MKRWVDGRIGNVGRRQFLASASVLGAASLVGIQRAEAAEPPPETRSIRLMESPIICLAPQRLAEELLRAEGFTDVHYVRSLNWNEPLPAGQADISMVFAPPQILQIDGGKPIVVLAGGHIGCVELVAREGIRSTLALKGKTIAVSEEAGDEKIFISLFLSYVGLDPLRDVEWQIHPVVDTPRLFQEGKVDAFLTGPPFGADLRARKIGRVIVNLTLDRPWSQYFCCLITGNRQFVQRHPHATKRALRAILKANDLCTAQPERAARLMQSIGLAPSYESALRAIREIPYARWREYDPEDSLRFYALRMREVGMIKHTPQQILANGADWRIWNELRRELKA